jgi:argininosuccinate synthase
MATDQSKVKGQKNGKSGKRPRLVLAYSGGLDTTVAVHWLTQKGYDVIALLVDLGQPSDLGAVRERAHAAGAKELVVVDAKEEFAKEYILPAIKSNALYEDAYPLSTALARPVIARHLAKVAVEKGAEAVAHGCTGKGNDQVRFEATIHALTPDLKVIAPVREWSWTREEEVEYAAQHGIPVPATKAKIYSVDENLYGRSVEGGPLEDPWSEPAEDAFEWTAAPERAKKAYVTVEFAGGAPVALDGKRLSMMELIAALNRIAGAAGVGRIDHVESRVVGIKSRETYECPAAVTLVAAHRALEKMVLPKDLLSFKAGVDQRFGEVVYEGTWFHPLREALQAFTSSTQERITGTVRMKLQAGQATVAGVTSPYALYSLNLATYGAGSTFDQRAAEGFIYVFSLPMRAWGLVGSGKGVTQPPKPAAKGIRRSAKVDSGAQHE